MKIFTLITLLISIFSILNANEISNSFKLCFGKKVPIEYEQKTPISRALADSVIIGEKMNEVIKKLGIPCQDSGKTKFIWHYMVEGGTYLQIIGVAKVTKAFQYSNADIR